MLILRYATILLTSLLSLLPGCTPQARGWQDPSPHRSEFVEVQPDVRLEVLPGVARGDRSFCRLARASAILRFSRGRSGVPRENEKDALVGFSARDRRRATIVCGVSGLARNDEERAALKAFVEATAAYVDRWMVNLKCGVPDARFRRLSRRRTLSVLDSRSRSALRVSAFHCGLKPRA